MLSFEQLQQDDEELGQQGEHPEQPYDLTTRAAPFHKGLPKGLP